MPLDLTPEFWDRLARRDERAWEDFYTEFDSLIRGIPRWNRWSFSPEVREEISQIIRAALFTSLHELRRQAALAGFIKQVCMNKCIDHLRRVVRERKVFAPPPAPAGESVTPPEPPDLSGAFDPIREIEHQERAQALAEMLGRLDPTCAQAIALFYRENLPYKEISGHLGIAVNTVGARLSKCLDKLKDAAKHSAVFREYFPPSNDGRTQETQET